MDSFGPRLCFCLCFCINDPMPRAVVRSDHPVLLLGAGEVTGSLVKAALRLAPLIVAADGGANVAVAMGLRPAAVIGDFDSISPATRAALDPATLHPVVEQETTDFEKCLTRIDAPLVLALGFTGARSDHALAVWNTLVRHSGRRCLILSRDDLAFVAPPRLRLHLPPGTRVSLFPMAPMRGTSTGLRWPIDAVNFAPDGAVGTSNEATGPVSLTFDARKMIVILPRGVLPAAIRALTAE
jgi:thiamine pyrophosphokinase